MRERANYALVYFGAQLGPDKRGLNLDWAEFVGDSTAPREFEVPVEDAREAYVGVQAYDVGEYGHEIRVNGASLGGFDLPPNDGWQYWMDSLNETALERGTNTIRIVRDADAEDHFAVGNVTVHWKEAVE